MAGATTLGDLVSAIGARAQEEAAENTVIEFGTPQEVLFSSQLPLEFEDKVRLMNQDGSFNAEAKVVAVQFEGGNMAVAARFTGNVSNWIIKPA